MGRFMSGFGMVVGVAAVAVVAYAQKRSAQTGRDLGAVLSNLPEELRQTQADLQRRLKIAMDAGRKAAAAKEAEIDHELGQDQARPPEAPDYIV